jgi:hypothetical protein
MLKLAGEFLVHGDPLRVFPFALSDGRPIEQLFATAYRSPP